MLSVSCTFSHMHKQGDEAREVLKPFYDQLHEISVERGIPEEILFYAVAGSSLKELMETFSWPKEEIQRTDDELHLIKNQID